MQTRTVDVAVIGAGTAGLSARREAAALGRSVLLIEGGPYGTTCARVGCMPSKLLIAAAEAAHHVAVADRFGVRVPGGVRIDGAAVLARVRAERDRFVGFVLDSVEAIPAEQRLRGDARFVGPTTLEVDATTRVEARAVVIATGSSPYVPPALAPLRPLVNDELFELRDLPASIAVIGAGVAGLELGQALSRLGVRTVVFSHSTRLGPITDPEVRRVAAEVIGRELEIWSETPVDASRVGDGFAIRWQTAGGETREERFEALFCATGRRPNLDRLDLAAAGVRGAPRVDPRTTQCGDLPIFLAGDAADYRPILHEAADEGRIAGINAARYPDVRAQTRRTPLNIVFTAPNIAVVGASYAELAGTDFEVGTASYDDQGRARVIGENAGVARVYAEIAGGALVGAELCAPRAEHTAHLLAWAVQCGLTVEQALAMPFYHPVIEEGIRTALRDLCARLRLRPRERKSDLESGPGA